MRERERGGRERKRPRERGLESPYRQGWGAQRREGSKP